MKRSDFSYDLPRELIARYPAEQRDASRMLILDGGSGGYRDGMFTDLPGLLRADDLLVLNDTRVIPARLYGTKDTGGRVEILVERIEGDNTLLAQVRASKTPKPGSRIRIDEDVVLEVIERRNDFYVLRLPDEWEDLMAVLEQYGHVPLPPYIDRPDAQADRERYQTVYARVPGAVAAPTAGLHFTDEMLETITSNGVNIGYVTLHIGAGTFQPMRVDNIEDHRMHTERFCIDAVLCEQISETRRRGGRVIAVGTTVVRCLETAAESGIRSMEGETEIFIYPGYEFRVADCLVTNFHLPESTLLMLVCAFGGTENVLNAYRHAVAKQYRFFSYGDAMFITKVRCEE